MATATLKQPQTQGKRKAIPVQQTAVQPVAPALVPMLGERQDQFFDRASRALRTSMPSVNRRTIAILDIWRRSQNNSELRLKAEAQFSPEQFKHFGPRCIFLEHTVPGNASSDQQPIRYDRKALQKLVDWANYRIRNSEQFAAISDGHTPSESEKAAGVAIPDVLGYSGPFYLGLLGDVDPKWAIYADEWVHVEDLARFAKLQRRSPEVWCGEPIERRTMDPIAALGAETPRLDSGMNPYSRAGDGRTVMRYSAAAAGPSVMPGPSNTFIPSAGAQKPRKTQYAAAGVEDMPFPGQNPGQPGQDPSQGTPDIGQAVMQAIQDLLPSIVQAVTQTLGGGDSDMPADDGQDTPRGMEPDDDDIPGMGGGMDDGMGQDADPGQDPMQSPMPPAGQAPAGQAPPAAPAAPDNDPEAAKYAAMGTACYGAYMAGKRSGAVKYSRQSAANELHQVVARQQLQLKNLKDEIVRERRDVARYSRLAELSQEFAFDPKEEAETAFDLTDAQFERHCNHTIAKYAKRGDVLGVDLYVEPGEPDRYSKGNARVNEDQVARYSRQAADIAAQKNAVKRGSTTFQAELDAIFKQHGISV